MSQQLANYMQSQEQGYSDNINNLFKLFQVHKRQTKFHYADQNQGCTFDKKTTILHAEINNYQETMRILWRMFDESYFKPVEPIDIQGIRYFNGLSSFSYGFGIATVYLGIDKKQFESQFWEDVQNIFKSDYLRFKIQQNFVNYQNWLKLMYIYWKTMSSSKNSKKRQQTEINSIKNKLLNILQTQLPQNEKLKLENAFLCEQLNIEITEDQITHQIQDLEQELINALAFRQATISRIQNQIKDEQLLKYIFINYEQIEAKNQGYNFNNLKSSSLQTVGNGQLELVYLRYEINRLQMKQAAESMTKIRKIQPSNSSFEIVIDFESAMNLNYKAISQQDFIKLNRLREYSLFNYYHTGCKSLFNFTSQNYLGFKRIYQKQCHQSKFQEITIKKLKQYPADPLFENFNAQFDKMEICHQCRMLFSPVNLRKCSYTSRQSGQPLPKSAYYDTYITQIVKYQHHNPQFIKKINSHDKLKNSYFHYSFIDGQYHCGRYYCSSCLKSYHRFKVDRFCPYCLGICNCYRCLRNGIIMKMKTMYSKLGGDIQTLQKESYFKNLYHEENVYSQMNHIKRKSTALIEFDEKQSQKLATIRAQLQQLRILASMTKRRELYKQKIIHCQFQILEKTLKRYGMSQAWKDESRSQDRTQ